MKNDSITQNLFFKKIENIENIPSSQTYFYSRKH